MTINLTTIILYRYIHSSIIIEQSKQESKLYRMSLIIVPMIQKCLIKKKPKTLLKHERACK